MQAEKRINFQACILAFISLGFFVAPRAKAAVVFEANFDSIPDWNIGKTLSSCSDWSGGHSNCPTAPQNFTGYYTVGGAGGQISAVPGGLADHTGGSAKKAWMSFYDRSDNGNGWTVGGSELSKTLDTDYPEIYVRFYSRVDPNWYQGTSGNGETAASTKFFRITHFDRTGNEFTYFGSGYTCPMGLMYLSTNGTYYSGRALFGTAYRGDPQATFYQSIPGNYTDPYFGMPSRDRHTDFPFYASASGAWNATGNWGDKAWHRWDIHMKMNSTRSAQDGVWQIAFDGVEGAIEKLRN